jgi:glucosyl-3-phosphoglycerate synthase
MSDFHQTGLVATFHRLGQFSLEKMEQDLFEISEHRGITLVLPSLYSEIKRPALKNIIQQLREVNYIREFVIALGLADAEGFKEAKKFFSVLPQKKTIIWINGPQIQSLYEELKKVNLTPGPEGKGRSAWTAYGYVIAEEGSKVIALHDCDIIGYSRELLGRLIFPVASTNMSYEFCKGFYGRVTNKMHGRVTRLFVTPLIRALIKMVGHLGLLLYYDSFRYPLSGEFSMITDLARIIRIPSDWGLEVGVLAEIYRSCSIKRICQAEICDNYEHKHQPLSAEDQKKGLNKMAIDIAKTIFRILATEGIVYTPGFFNSLRSTYLRLAQDTIARYHGDAMINGLKYDRHKEGTAVEVFTEAINKAGEIITQDPLGPPLIPNWNRVFSALPDFSAKLLAAVEADNK